MREGIKKFYPVSIILIISLLAPMAMADTTLQPEPEQDTYTRYTDTITHKNWAVNETTGETYSYEGKETYIFNVTKTSATRNEDGSLTLETVLKPNQVTNIINLEETPAVTKQEAVKKFNENYFYKDGNLTETQYEKLKQQAHNISFKVKKGSASSKSLERNILSNSGKQVINIDPDNSGDFELKFGSESALVGGSNGAQETYNNYKPVKVTSATGNPGESKVQPVYLECGSASKTGTGVIEIPCDNIDGVEDIDFGNENDVRLDYEIESFSLDQGGSATVWVRQLWIRDGTEQLRVYYGNGSTDQQDRVGAWGHHSVDSIIVNHLEESGGTVEDSSDNNYSSTSQSYNPRQAGQFGYSAGFDGSSDYIQFTDEPEFSVMNTGKTSTITLWYYVNSSKVTGTGSNLDDFDRHSGYDLAGEYGVHPQSQTNGNSKFSPRFDTFGDNNVDAISDTLNYDEWYMVTYQIDAGKYIDTIIDGQNEYEDGITDTSGDIDDPLCLGAFDATCSQGHFPGKIDEARIHSQVKSKNWTKFEFDASAKGGRTFFSQQSSGDDINPTVDSAEPSDGATINTRTPQINGTFSDNQELSNYTIYIDGVNQSSGKLSGTSDSASYTTSQLSYGSHNYNWTVEDAAGNTASIQRTFNVNEPPTANAAVNSSTVGIGETFQSDGTDSSDPDGSISSYEWDWTSDGIYDTTGSTATHSYSSSGTYTITLRVTDNNGATSTDTVDVTVKDEESPSINSGDIIDNVDANDIVSTGQSITIQSDITDNVDIDTVTAEYLGTNYTLTDGDNDDTYNNDISQPSSSDGSKDLVIYANDTSSNNNSTIFTDVITIDNTPPTLSNPATSPDPVKQGETITLSIDISDTRSSLDETKVEVFGTNHTLTQGSGSSYTADVQVDYGQSPGTYTAEFYASDTAGNNNTETKQFQVEEIDAEYGLKTYGNFTTTGNHTIEMVEGYKNTTVHLYGAGTEDTDGDGNKVGGGYTNATWSYDNISTTNFTLTVGQQQINEGSEATWFFKDQKFTRDGVIAVAAGAGGSDNTQGGAGGGLQGGTADADCTADQISGYGFYNGEPAVDSSTPGGGDGWYGGCASALSGGGGGGGSGHVDPATKSGDTVQGEGAIDANGWATVQTYNPDTTSPVIENETYTGGETVTSKSTTISFDTEDPETDLKNQSIKIVETGENTTGTTGTFNFDNSGSYTVEYTSKNTAGLTTTETATINVQLPYDEIVVDEDKNRYIIEDDRLFKKSSGGVTEWTKEFNNTLYDLQIANNHLFFHDDKDVFGYQFDGTQSYRNNDTGVFEMDSTDNQVIYAFDDSDANLGVYDVNDQGELAFVDWVQDSGYTKSQVTDLELGENPSDEDVIVITKEDTVQKWSYDSSQTVFVDDGSFTPGSTTDDIRFVKYYRDEQKILVADTEQYSFMYAEGSLGNVVGSTSHNGITDGDYAESYTSIGVINDKTWERWDNNLTSNSSTEVTEFTETKNNSVNDVFVEGLYIYGVTQGGETFEDQFFNTSEADANITAFNLNSTENIESGSEIAATVETDSRFLVDKVTVEGEELVYQGGNTWNGTFTVPDEEGNYTATAKLLAEDGTEIDSATQDYNVVEFLPLPLVATAVIGIILLIIYLVYWRRRRNEQKAARGEPR